MLLREHHLVIELLGLEIVELKLENGFGGMLIRLERLEEG